MKLAVDAIGTFTSVGTSLGETMGSLSVALSMPNELPFLAPDGKMLVAAPTALALDGVVGDDRLAAMAGFALAECARRQESDALPVMLCCAESGEPPEGWESFLSELSTHSGVRIDVKQSRIFREGRAGIAPALLQAAELISSQQARACYVGGVDSLIRAERLESLMQNSRVRSQTTGGFMPGEAAAFVRVTSLPVRRAWGVIAGVGASRESATRESGEVNTGVGLTQAMRSALDQARLQMSDVAFFAHDASGERFGFTEVAFATVRSRPKKMQKWTAAISVGEVGAAMGPLSVGYLAFMLGSGGAPGTAAMFVTASDGAARGAVVVVKWRGNG